MPLFVDRRCRRPFASASTSVTSHPAGFGSKGMRPTAPKPAGPEPEEAQEQQTPIRRRFVATLECAMTPVPGAATLSQVKASQLQPSPVQCAHLMPSLGGDEFPFDKTGDSFGSFVFVGGQGRLCIQQKRSCCLPIASRPVSGGKGSLNRNKVQNVERFQEG